MYKECLLPEAAIAVFAYSPQLFPPPIAVPWTRRRGMGEEKGCRVCPSLALS